MWTSPNCGGLFQLTSSVGGSLSRRRLECEPAKRGAYRHTCVAEVHTQYSCPCTDGSFTARKIGLHCSGCDIHYNSNPTRNPTRRPTVLVLVLHRIGEGSRSFGKQASGLLRTLASLLLVGTKMPIYVLASGWSANISQSLMELNATLYQSGVTAVVWQPSVTAPRWASPFYISTFAKMGILNLSLRLGARVLMIDNDVRALNNVDHLCVSPAPAFVYSDQEGWRGVNSGVALVDIQKQAGLNEAWQLFDWLGHHERWRGLQAYSRLGWDGSDQTFWSAWVLNRSLTSRPVYELSRRHNMFRFDDLAEGDCFPYVPELPQPDACSEVPHWLNNVLLWHKLEGGGAHKLWKLSTSARKVWYLEIKLGTP